jgi:putative oxidoreductase
MNWSRFAPYLLSVLRIVAAFVFIGYGTAKIFAYPAPLVPSGPVPLLSRLGAAGLMEVIGGPLLLVGVFTRPLAFLMAGEMAVAYFIRHAPMGTWLWPALNDGASAVLFCFVWLYISAAGPGPISIDAMRKGAKR